jgi:hypothetical protein
MSPVSSCQEPDLPFPGRTTPAACSWPIPPGLISMTARAASLCICSTRRLAYRNPC